MTVMGVVAIGRNEGERLRRCLTSLARLGDGVQVVYVDSGSHDGSADWARSIGTEVVELDKARPFSAARARNAGFERVMQLAPNLKYVMLMDGDCEIVPGWLERAVSELEAKPRAAVVCGRNRELHPEQSIYNRLADLEWDTPVGEAMTCGGSALFRVEAFQEVGGYDPSAAAGEEPELCQRLRQAGWSVWRIDAEMTRHDMAITRFRQWWRRQYRSGYNGLDIVTRFPGKDRPFSRNTFRAWVWGFGWPLAVLVAGLLGWGLRGWGVGLLAAGLVALLMPIQCLRVAWQVRHRVAGPRMALGYGILMMVSKWGELAGQLGYLFDRHRGQAFRLIEYKQLDRSNGLAAQVDPTDVRS